MKYLFKILSVLLYHLIMWAVILFDLIIVNFFVLIWHLDYKKCGKPSKFTFFGHPFYDKYF